MGIFPVSIVNSPDINSSAEAGCYNHIGSMPITTPVSSPVDMSVATGWVANNYNPTWQGSVPNPLGVPGVWGLTAPAASSNHNYAYSMSVATNTLATFSVYVKYASTLTKAQVGFNPLSPTTLDLASGTVFALGAAKFAGIRPVGNGWWRVAIACTNVGGMTGMLVAGCDNTGAAVYTGLGVVEMYYWGAQVDLGDKANVYLGGQATPVNTSEYFSKSIATCLGNRF